METKNEKNQAEKDQITKDVMGSITQWTDGAICIHEMAYYIYAKAESYSKLDCCDFPCSLHLVHTNGSKFIVDFQCLSMCEKFVEVMIERNPQISTYQTVKK